MQHEHYKLNAATRTRAAMVLGDRRRFLGEGIELMAKRLRKSKGDLEALERGKGDPKTLLMLEWAKRLSQTARVNLPSMRIATFSNFAGGVGKTSLVREFGLALSAMGLRVLLIDTDPQANLTEWLGVRSHDLPLDQTIAFTVSNSDGRLPDPILIQPGLHLIPSTLELGAERAVVVPNDPLFLRRALLRETNFDVVLIDACPSVFDLGQTAAIAADEILIPLTPTDKALTGLRGIEKQLNHWQSLNPLLSVGSLIVNRYDRNTNNDSGMLASFQRYLTNYHLLGPIPKATAFDVAQLQHQPVALMNSLVGEAVYTAADGLLERWDATLEWTGGLA